MKLQHGFRLPRYAAGGAFVLLFTALTGLLVLTASTGSAKNTADLTGEEIYARYLEKTSDLVYLVEDRYTRTIDPFTGGVVREERLEFGWDLRPSYPGKRPFFVTFPCVCFSTDYPVDVQLMAMTEIEGRKLIHLFITDPIRGESDSQPHPEVIVVWQDLFLEPLTFEPFEIITHIDQYRDGSRGNRYTELRTSVSRIFLRTLPQDTENPR